MGAARASALLRQAGLWYMREQAEVRRHPNGVDGSFNQPGDARLEVLAVRLAVVHDGPAQLLVVRGEVARLVRG